MAYTCVEASGDSNHESLNTVPEKSDKIPSYSELKKQYEIADAQQEKTKELLTKMKTRLEELTAQVLELSNSKAILERENNSLLQQVNKFQDNSMENDDRIKSLNIKVLNYL